jgi:hypothetical protein
MIINNSGTMLISENMNHIKIIMIFKGKKKKYLSQ